MKVTCVTDITNVIYVTHLTKVTCVTDITNVHTFSDAPIIG